MRARSLAVLVVAAGAVTALVWWRRRSAAGSEPRVQLGLSGGATLTLDRSDPSTIELETLAVGVRDSFTGGA
ncbi:MAG: hypothetical protein GX624_05800 [Actinobacteria bacterium]|nr:hypothetical protein [Actinomycetota bacterium]